MTSPAQLKYLDAMGIPVWVSRDLIICSEGTIELSQNTSVSKSHQDNSNASNSSALSILSSLDENPSRETDKTTQQLTENISSNEDTQLSKPAIDQVVTESVDQANLDVVSTKPVVTDENSSVNLHFQTSNHYVYANGSEEADWMVIGHSPESFNAIGQEPFAAESGELLNNMLRAVGLNQPRSEAYLINAIDINKSSVVDSEVKNQLRKKLLSTIDKVKPKVILLVGQNAAQNILNLDDPLIVMRSKVHRITELNIPCIVTYYPSYLLQKTTDKRKAWNDLKLAMSQLD